MQLLTYLFRDAHPDSKLWPMSAAAFRSRFDAVLRALQVPAPPKFSPLVTPGGLRGGGATALWVETEDEQKVRKRGRWMRLVTVEVYVQEVAHHDLFEKLKPSTISVLQYYSNALPAVLSKAFALMESKVPCSLWYRNLVS